MTQIKLTIAGCGDAFAAGGRHHSCYFIEAGETRFLLDCGASAPVALQQAGVSPLAFDTIFITHLHGDHFGGLPFLLIDAIYASRRKRPLTIAGPPGVKARFWAACEALYPSIGKAERHFELRFAEIRAGERAIVEDVPVQAFEMKHFSGAPSHALRFSLGRKIFAFTGDAGWTDAVIEAGRGADLYLMECYTYDMRLEMHLDFKMIESQAAATGAKRIMLTHMSEAMLARRAEATEKGFLLAEDGLVFEF